MGIWSSAESPHQNTDDGRRPEGVKEINDSLFILHSPKGKIEADIIFFHGLQRDYIGAYWKTWISDVDGEPLLWPQTFLGTDFENVRVLSVSYDSCAQKTSTGGQLDMYQIGENLVGNILEDGDADVGNRPVILVGHSLGGLVIKEFLLRVENKRHQREGAAKDEFDRFVNENIVGIFYYATPHNGSKVADLAMNKLARTSALVAFLQTLNKEAARLNNDFGKWRKNASRNIQTYSVVETRPTPLLGQDKMIVEEASARYDTDGFYNAPEDHLSVCKPKKTTQSTYKCLRTFIIECVAQPEKHVLTVTDNIC